MALRQLIPLLDDPPFPQRADHAALTTSWQAVARRLQAGLDRADLVAMIPAYERRLGRRPYDDLTRTMLADLLRGVGDQRRAARLWREIESHQPPADWLDR